MFCEKKSNEMDKIALFLKSNIIFSIIVVGGRRERKQNSFDAKLTNGAKWKGFWKKLLRRVNIIIIIMVTLCIELFLKFYNTFFLKNVQDSSSFLLRSRVYHSLNTCKCLFFDGFDGKNLCHFSIRSSYLKASFCVCFFSLQSRFDVHLHTFE